MTLEHGARYGSLTVLKQVQRYDGRWQYRVGCTCGNSGLVVTASSLTSGRRTCCGRCARAKAKWGLGNAIANRHEKSISTKE